MRKECAIKTWGQPSDVEAGAQVKRARRPVESSVAWLESEDIRREGAVFRPIDRWENVSDQAMTAASVNHMVKRRLTTACCDDNDCSAHGLWAGYLLQAARDGAFWRRRSSSRSKTQPGGEVDGVNL